jgi:hypothetical protein
MKMKMLIQKMFLFQCAPEANEKEDVKALSTKSLMEIFLPSLL